MAYVAIKGVLGSLLGNGWKSVSLGLLFVIFGLSGYSFALKRQASSQAVVATQQLKEVNKQSALVESAVHVSTSRARKTTEKLNHVLEVHKQWGDQPVPDDVINELCHKVTCTDETTSKVHSSNDSRKHTKRTSQGAE